MKSLFTSYDWASAPLPGHVYCLATYDNQRGDKQLCKNDSCVNVKEDVDHLIIMCPTYSKERCVCFEEGCSATLNVLEKDPAAVIRYLEMIGRTSAPEL